MAAAIIIPAVVPVALELIRLAAELLREHREKGGTLTEEQKAALWAQHSSVTSAIVQATPVPEPPT